MRQLWKMPMCIVWEGKPMRKLIAIIHYEYKMQFHRPATWGMLLGITIYALLDTYPSARNLARLEFLNEPAYFVYRTMSLNGLVLLFGMLFLLAELCVLYGRESPCVN